MARVPVNSGEWRSVVTRASTPKAAARAHDRADVMRVGDLVEHQNDAAFRFDSVEIAGGQGLGLEHDALMDGLAAKAAIHILGRDDMRHNARGFAILPQAAPLRRASRRDEAACAALVRNASRTAWKP